jgi:hypothetical protein
MNRPWETVMHRCCIAIAFVVLCTSGVHAGGWQRSYGWSSAYCYPVPTYSYPLTYRYPAVMPLATSPLAAPTPAPPSPQTGEPPLNRKAFMPPAEKPIAKPGPTVYELRADSPATAKNRCRVGFWNQTGRDVSLVVAGNMQVVPHDRAVTLELPRTFVWQVDQQPARTEKIADEGATHEIVIR